MRSYWVLRPGAGFIQHLHNLLRMACFLSTSLLRAFLLHVVKRNQARWGAGLVGTCDLSEFLIKDRRCLMLGWRLRWEGGAGGCGCCDVCFVALALLFAVIVFALQRLLCCSLLLYDCGLGCN